MRSSLLALAALIGAFATSSVGAQPPLSERPRITVGEFRFGAAMPHSGTRRPVYHHDASADNALGAAIAAGVSELVIQHLGDSQRFRIFERPSGEPPPTSTVTAEPGATEADLGPRYFVTGTISRLGVNDQEIGGGALGSRALAGLLRLAIVGARGSLTTMHLTARVVDLRTGEIIGSFTGVGRSRKRWSVLAAGADGGGAAGARVGAANFRETAIGESADRAAAAIADSIVALRATRLRP